MEREPKPDDDNMSFFSFDDDNTLDIVSGRRTQASSSGFENVLTEQLEALRHVLAAAHGQDCAARLDATKVRSVSRVSTETTKDCTSTASDTPLVGKIVAGQIVDDVAYEDNEVAALKAAVEKLQADPAVAYDSDLVFFKDFLLSWGAKVPSKLVAAPPAVEKAPGQNEELYLHVSDPLFAEAEVSSKPAVAPPMAEKGPKKREEFYLHASDPQFVDAEVSSKPAAAPLAAEKAPKQNGHFYLQISDPQFAEAEACMDEPTNKDGLCRDSDAFRRQESNSKASTSGKRDSRRVSGSDNSDEEDEPDSPGKVQHVNQDAAGPNKGGMFMDAAAMKAKLRENMCKPEYNVANFYHKVGLFPYLATHKIFEGATLSVIALNALWISVDTDHNQAEVLLGASPVFQFMEHFFCTYFSFEWFCRFMAFKRKRNGLRDAWFVFDTGMVVMMVAETWLMTIIMLATGAGGGGGMGNASILRLARLLRLSRMARMARLFRAMPELMILIKGMMAAMRSVLFTLLLLLILTYIFGITFTQLMVDTAIGQSHFSTVPLSMHTLLLDGTFLDGIGTVVRELGSESLIYGAIFYIFVLLSALTVMNMLIGVLCEVVSAVAATEKEELTVGFVKEKLQEVMKTSGLDEDGDNEISKSEFVKILQIPDACRCLQEVGVDVVGLVDLSDFLFEGDGDDEEGGGEQNLTFSDFMEVVLQLRGTNGATVKDITDLRKFVRKETRNLEEKLERFLSNPNSGSRIHSK